MQAFTGNLPDGYRLLICEDPECRKLYIARKDDSPHAVIKYRCQCGKSPGLKKPKSVGIGANYQVNQLKRMKANATRYSRK